VQYSSKNFFKIYQATRKFYARQAGTALLAACESDRTEVALYLLRCGADPAISGRIPFTGMTVFHFIAYYGNVEVMTKVVEFLVAKKGKEVLLQCVTASDHFGLTPLHWAAWAWQVDV
jgi:ankyrin repeat protein